MSCLIPINRFIPWPEDGRSIDLGCLNLKFKHYGDEAPVSIVFETSRWKDQSYDIAIMDLLIPSPATGSHKLGDHWTLHRAKDETNFVLEANKARYLVTPAGVQQLRSLSQIARDITRQVIEGCD